MTLGELWLIIAGIVAVFLTQVSILCYVAANVDVPVWLCISAVNSGLLASVIVIIVLFRQRRSIW